MLRSRSREMLVVVIVLCFVLSLAHGVQAAPRASKVPVAEGAETGWFEAAIAWVFRAITGGGPESIGVTSAADTIPLGSCLDPNGGNSHCL